MYSPHKHSYLQSRTCGVNPRLVNRSVNLARGQPTLDTADLNPPFLRLTSEQPNIPIENVDVTRRPCAFGRWALPKLRRELHSVNETTVVEAINSIMDLAHDPEKGYEAVRLKIPLRMVDLLTSANMEIRERTCMALKVMAGSADACEMMVRNEGFLEALAMAVEDPSISVRVKAAALLEVLSRSWMGACELTSSGFVLVLLQNLQNEDEIIVAIHLRSLDKLLQAEGKIVALEYDAFPIFEDLMDNKTDPEILAGAANCVAFLAVAAQGKEVAFNDDVLVKLNRLLHDERPEVYGAAASAIMFCTVLTKAKLRAKYIKQMPERLLELCKDYNHPQVQISSVKALTNISEHPYIRRKMLREHMEEIRNIPVHRTMEMKEYKNTLIQIVEWTPESAM